LRVKLFIFDLDGTIVDSSTTVQKLFQKIKDEQKADYMTKRDFNYASSLGGKKMIEYIFGNKVNSDFLLDEFRKKYNNISLVGEKLFPQILDAFTFIRSKKIPIALLTNKPRNLTKKVLKHHKLKPCFDYVLTGSDIIRKPSPDGIKKTLLHFKINDEDVVFVGDSKIDSDTAKAANIKFIYYCPNDRNKMGDIQYYKLIKNYSDLIGLDYEQY
jgi:phosphoglycolate phosphatase